MRWCGTRPLTTKPLRPLAWPRSGAPVARPFKPCCRSRAFRPSPARVPPTPLVFRTSTAARITSAPLTTTSAPAVVARAARALRPPAKRIAPAPPGGAAPRSEVAARLHLRKEAPANCSASRALSAPPALRPPSSSLAFVNPCCAPGRRGRANPVRCWPATSAGRGCRARCFRNARGICRPVSRERLRGASASSAHPIPVPRRSIARVTSWRARAPARLASRAAACAARPVSAAMAMSASAASVPPARLWGDPAPAKPVAGAAAASTGFASPLGSAVPRCRERSQVF